MSRAGRHSLPWSKAEACAAAVAALVAISGCGGSDSSSSGGAPVSGKAGSQARFALAGGFLYTVDRQTLHVFDVLNPESPAAWSEQYIGTDIETLFAYGRHLFVGSETGVIVYDISDTRFPKELGSLSHVRSCDPVVVEGNTAYATLRSGAGGCGGGGNVLDIIDIGDPTFPKLLTSYPMHSPAGLGVDDARVFVCDGIAGLKVLDVSDPSSIVLIDQVIDQDCYDVIPDGGVLIVSGAAGLFQYDYTAFPMKELSAIQLFATP